MIMNICGPSKNFRQNLWSDTQTIMVFITNSRAVEIQHVFESLKALLKISLPRLSDHDITFSKISPHG